MKIFIRVKPRWISFVNSSELQQFIESYMGGNPIIGDISTYSDSAIQRLLKFVEENPQVDLYSSRDIKCMPLLSRATQIIKEYPVKEGTQDVKQYQDSLKEYEDMNAFLSSTPNQVKLLLKGVGQRVETMLLSNQEEQW